MDYQIHPSDTDESFFIADLSLSELRLFNQADLVWLILFPKRESVIELIDLNKKDQEILLDEINRISMLLKDNFPCDKLNIATLGNILPRLHIHIIARRYNDAYFPKSCFGVSRIPYTLAERAERILKIRKALR